MNRRQTRYQKLILINFSSSYSLSLRISTTANLFKHIFQHQYFAASILLLPKADVFFAMFHTNKKYRACAVVIVTKTTEWQAPRWTSCERRASSRPRRAAARLALSPRRQLQSVRRCVRIESVERPSSTRPNSRLSLADTRHDRVPTSLSLFIFLLSEVSRSLVSVFLPNVRRKHKISSVAVRCHCRYIERFGETQV